MIRKLSITFVGPKDSKPEEEGESVGGIGFYIILSTFKPLLKVLTNRLSETFFPELL